jgi:hypothetical protein
MVCFCGEGNVPCGSIKRLSLIVPLNVDNPVPSNVLQMSGVYCGEDVDGGRLGYDAVWFCRRLPVILISPSSN